jgi:hypothetical protein
MPTTIDSAGITFNDTTSLTSAVLAANSVGATQIANGSVTAAKLGTNEQKQIAKAWVNFSGIVPVGIRSSFNVSSITRTGVGDFTVNFTTAMADVNYTVVLGSNKSAAQGFTSGDLITKNTTNASLEFRYGTSFVQDDATQISVIVFGN